MQVTIQLPDEIATQLGAAGEIPRQALEALAAEAYRTQKLSRNQVSRLLGLDYWETEEFFTHHEAKRPYTAADLYIDRQSLDKLDSK
jgi:hypothetical protein